MSDALFRARAPLRVSFAGGGTDVPPFPAREGGLVLSATINRHAFGTLRARRDDRIVVESIDLGAAVSFAASSEVTDDGRLDLATAAIRRLGEGREPSGFDLFLRSSAPVGSGLGGSSALIVALVGVLRRFHDLPLNEYALADLAHSIEREDLGLAGGMQDHYAATFGGFNFIEFGEDAVLVNPLRIPADTVAELECNLLLCFTGTARASDRIITDQRERYERGEDATLDGLRNQKELAVAMKDALLRGKLDDFGSLLGTAWEFKRRMSPRIATPFIEEAYAAAIEAGALGGKVTGAGGGGFMLFYCRYDRKHRVAEALERLGATVTDFAFEPRGLESWTAHAR